MLTKQYFVYILASRRNGTLYFGVTNDLGNMSRPCFRALYDYEIDVLYDYLSARGHAVMQSR